jgi:hypothetical protein
MKRNYGACGGKGREEEANGIAMRQVTRSFTWRLPLQAFPLFPYY